MLSLGDAGWIVLSIDPKSTGEQWNAVVVDPIGKQTLIAPGLSLAYAQGVAEDYARECGAIALVNPQAAWRQRPASDKQIWLLRKLHVDHEPDLTSGEACDLISQEKLAQALSRAA